MGGGFDSFHQKNLMEIERINAELNTGNVFTRMFKRLNASVELERRVNAFARAQGLKYDLEGRFINVHEAFDPSNIGTNDFASMQGRRDLL